VQKCLSKIECLVKIEGAVRIDEKRDMGWGKGSEVMKDEQRWVIEHPRKGRSVFESIHRRNDSIAI
jgi:hypothetical protein